MLNSKFKVQNSKLQFKIKNFKKAFRFELLTFNSHAGFTMVELLVIIGVLSVISVGLLITLDPFGQLQKGWDAQRKSDLSQIQRTLEQYYQDNGMYPPNTTDTNPGGVIASYQIISQDADDPVKEWDTPWLPYMAKLPKDPSSAKNYVYILDPDDTDSQTYYLYASLDRGAKDAQVCNSGNACLNVPAGVTCGGATDICNYGISSSNTSP